MVKRLLAPSLLAAFAIVIGCSATSPAEGRARDEFNAGVEFTVQATVQATIAGVGYIEPVPPTPTSAAVSSVPAATEPAPTEVSFEQRRSLVIDYLGKINAAITDFLDSYSSASIDDDLYSHDVIAVNRPLDILVQLPEGALARINELEPTILVSELTAIQRSYENFFRMVTDWQVDYREAVLSGDSDLADLLVNEYPTHYVITEIELAGDLQEGLLARFNIPDSEVGYERSVVVPSNDIERQTVQAAMDLYMAVNELLYVEPIAAPTNDFFAPGLFPEYLRTHLTQCYYTWDIAGAISQHFC